MCGIAGYSYPTGSGLQDASALLRMVRQLARRGPDDEGLALFSHAEARAAALRTSESDPQAVVGPRTTSSQVVIPAEPVEGRFDFAHQVGLGHRRFSIIDTSAAGHQPF